MRIISALQWVLYFFWSCFVRSAMLMEFKRIAYIGIVGLGIACIFCPFIYLSIGPQGYDYYGPNVPDIYIYGGLITGKDRSFITIGFSMAIQLIGILLYVGLSCAMLVRNKSKKKNINLACISFILLLLFPWWMDSYVHTVYSNSDGADLTTHYKFGYTLFYILLVLNIFILITNMAAHIAKKKNLYRPSNNASV